MQDRRAVELIDNFCESFLVACRFKSEDNGCDWAFVGVYCPILYCNRRFLWDEMVGVFGRWDLP